MEVKFIKNRDGDLVPFDMSRIERAIEKAAQATKYIDTSFIETITK